MSQTTKNVQAAQVAIAAIQAESKAIWQRFESAAKDNDIADAWRLYAAYLRSCGIYSGMRQTIHDLAVRTACHLRDRDGE